MVQKLRAQIGVSDDPEFIATLIKVTPEWLTFKEPGKRPFRVRRSEFKFLGMMDSPEDIQIHLMEEMIKHAQPGYKAPNTIKPVSYH
jgi:hypothetical protein